MGYRSQVRSLIFGSPEKLDVFITTNTLITQHPALKKETGFKENLKRYSVEIEIYNSETSSFDKKIIHVLDLYGDSWKWYEGYGDVQAWTNLTEQAQEFGLDHEFLRIGEETNDIEHTSTSDNDRLLSVSRTINNEMQIQEEIPLNF